MEREFKEFKVQIESQVVAVKVERSPLAGAMRALVEEHGIVTGMVHLS